MYKLPQTLWTLGDQAHAQSRWFHLGLGGHIVGRQWSVGHGELML